ncbi:hypothetical protein IFT47_20500 [Pseudomonas sp. CFBP 13711]|uniref:hypothetical protein n=1 Tax=unclassified Pseudomonas TaxID=196821 RepID=UPI001786AE41|nr:MULTISPECIES: hypothetical protein [unclassified Pseudomonas]MBD8709015.1 hypothetical protein [Pseudomonas sp. CFBP 13711]MBD8715056.1 hypothetical protein [Pseudomonas sp. CFBP 13715]
MKQLKALFSMSKTQAAVATSVAATVAAPMTFAAGNDIDFSTMIGGIAGATAIAAIVSMGVVKIGPNFAKWAVNKVASFF